MNSLIFLLPDAKLMNWIRLGMVIASAHHLATSHKAENSNLKCAFCLCFLEGLPHSIEIVGEIWWQLAIVEKDTWNGTLIVDFWRTRLLCTYGMCVWWRLYNHFIHQKSFHSHQKKKSMIHTSVPFGLSWWHWIECDKVWRDISYLQQANHILGPMKIIL